MQSVYIHLMKSRQFTKNNAQGIHLKKPSTIAMINAIETALKDGYTTIYVYNSSASLKDIAWDLSKELDIPIGWSNFCQTIPAFKINFSA